MRQEQRPWGKFIVYAENEICSVKILYIEPKRRLSLQYHNQRSEYWIVLSGIIYVTTLIDPISEKPGLLEKQMLRTGDDFYILKGIAHRAENNEDVGARVLEISYGVFDEADIVRIEDDYGRR